MRGRTQLDGSTPREARHDYWGVVLEAPDGPELGRFYAELLGWTIENEADDGCAIVPMPTLGAQEADFQPQDDVRVMFDPAGHPFCLYTAGIAGAHGSAGSSRDQAPVVWLSKNAVQSASAASPVPRMNSSTMSCAPSSLNCTGGDFMK